MAEVRWLSRPEKHDYPAAASYLSMLAGPSSVDELLTRLWAAEPVLFKAKDVLRAAGLALLPVDNPHVATDLAKIHSGQPLSPILLVRGDLALGRAAADRRRVPPGLRELSHRREHRHPVSAGRPAAERLMAARYTVVAIIELGVAAVEPFDAYERRVLPLLGRHGGRLERRLRSAEGRTEVHVLSFDARAGYDAYLADPDRAALRPLLAGLDIQQRVLPVTDVT